MCAWALIVRRVGGLSQWLDWDPDWDRDRERDVDRDFCKATGGGDDLVDGKDAGRCCNGDVDAVRDLFGMPNGD
jgi:hypothetical protein